MVLSDPVTEAETSLEKEWSREAHSRALMLRRRCGHCAEAVGPSVLFRGLECPSCGRRAEWPPDADAESLIDAVANRWRNKRLVVYGLVTLATGLTGFLPLVPTVIAVAFMVVLRHAFLREPLSWFGPARRVVTGLNLKLWLMTVSAVTLVLNALLALVPFANVVLNAAVCLATTALFVEVALRYLGGRLRREAKEGPRLEAWEWGVPAALLGVLVASSVAAAGVVVMTTELVSELFG